MRRKPHPSGFYGVITPFTDFMSFNSLEYFCAFFIFFFTIYLFGMEDGWNFLCEKPEECVQTAIVPVSVAGSMSSEGRSCRFYKNIFHALHFSIQVLRFGQSPSKFISNADIWKR